MDFLSETLPPEVKLLVSVLANKENPSKEKALAANELQKYMLQQRPRHYIVDDAHLFQVDTWKIARIMDSPESLTPSFQEMLSGIIESIIHPPYILDKTAKIKRIRGWFTRLQQIGSSSIEGYAFVGGFDGRGTTTDVVSPDLFVIKAPRTSREDILIQETVVGLYGTNPLRQYIPNFMYVYTAFTCSPPITGKIRKVGKLSFRDAAEVKSQAVTWCTGSARPVTYMVMEKISGESYISFAQRCTAREFVEVYLQVLNALSVAYQSCEFTHHDLHANNVLVSERSGRYLAIPYFGGGDYRSQSKYLMTRHLATIIDYGRCRFTYNGLSFGKRGGGWDNTSSGADDVFPLADAYRLLLSVTSSLYALSVQRRQGRISEILEVAETIYSFFLQPGMPPTMKEETSRKEGSLYQRVRDRKKGDYFILNPRWKEAKEKPGLIRVPSLADLIEWVETKYSGLVIGSIPSSSDQEDLSLHLCDPFSTSKSPETLFLAMETITALKTASSSSIDDIGEKVKDLDLSRMLLYELSGAREYNNKARSMLSTVTLSPFTSTFSGWGPGKVIRTSHTQYLEDLTHLLQAIDLWRCRVLHWIDLADLVLKEEQTLEGIEQKVEALREEALRTGLLIEEKRAILKRNLDLAEANIVLSGLSMELADKIMLVKQEYIERTKEALLAF